MAWGDYDNDNSIDLLLTGSTAGGPDVAPDLSPISGAFTTLDATFRRCNRDDGRAIAMTFPDLDLILLSDGNTAHTQLYRNTDCILIQAA
ncbi:MAG: hypothetical protein R2867_13265 [Caldilineaceae bacterium]